MSSGRRLPLALTFVAVLGLAFAVSCKGFFPPSTLQSLSVGPVDPTIQTGNSNNTKQFTAVGTYDDGVRPDTKVAWSIVPADGSIATLSAGGLATAVSEGTATVTATSTEIPTISGSTTLTVTVGCIQSIAVTPVNPTGTHGNTLQFTAKATTCNGVFDITDTATWTSSNTSVATIDSKGLATLIAAGTTNITASAAGVVSPAQQLTVN